MAEYRFTYTIEPGIALFDRVLHSRWGYISDMSDILNDVAGQVYTANKRQFTTEGVEAFGKRWASLKPGYAKWKAKHYPGKTILRRSDLMMLSLTNRGDANAIFELTRNSLAIGTTLFYFRFHMIGTRYMPARPQGLNDPTKKAIVKTFHRGMLLKGERMNSQPSLFNVWTPEGGSPLNPGQGSLF